MATTQKLSEAILKGQAYYILLLDEYLVKLRGGGNCADHLNKLLCLKKLIRGLKWDLSQEINNDLTTAVYERLVLEINDYYGDALPVADNVVIPTVTIITGIAGPAGKDGKDGLSAYQLAVAAGFPGNEAEWRFSLKGRDAYQSAVDHGFQGTEAEWLEYLKTSEREYVDDLLAQLNLQKVTDVGNRTDNDIILDKSKVSFETLDIATKIVQLQGFGQGLDIDSQGNVYVMDNDNLQVVKYSPDLSTSSVIIDGTFNGFYSPNNVAIDRQDNIYVADYNNYRILKFTQGQPLNSLGVVVAGGNGAGAGLNQLHDARGIAFDLNNQMYVTDGYNNRVLKYTAGSVVGTVVAGGNGAGTGLNQLNGPNSLVFDNQGLMYVLDSSNYRVLKYNLALSSSGVIVGGGNGSGPALNQIGFSPDVDIDKNGNLYVGDTTNDRIIKFTPGNLTGVIVSGGLGRGTGPGQYNALYASKISADGKYTYATDLISNRLIKDYIGAVKVDLEAIEGELYRNAKRLLTELDIFDPSALATKVQVDDINNVKLPAKVDKDPSQTAGRVIYVGADGKLVGTGTFTFDIASGQLKVNTTASNSNYKMLLGGGLDVLSGAINMAEYQSVLYMSDGRCALLVDGNGMQYRLANNDNTDFPDTSKQFTWRNKGFVHFKCYTEVLTMNGANPGTWKQVTELQKFVRMPNLQPSSGSYQIIVRNEASKELELLNFDASGSTNARKKVSDLPLIDNEDLSALQPYDEYRTSGGFTKYKLPTTGSTFTLEFTNEFY